jgi:hypothetical protein
VSEVDSFCDIFLTIILYELLISPKRALSPLSYVTQHIGRTVHDLYKEHIREHIKEVASVRMCSVKTTEWFSIKSGIWGSTLKVSEGT